MTETDHELDGAGAPPPVEPIAPVTPTIRVTPAEAARTLLHHAERAALATLAVEPAGYPIGAVVRYGVLPDGRPVLGISGRAEPTRDLEADPRASVLVTEAHPMGEPRDGGHLTLLGTARRTDDPAARAAFVARNPGAADGDVGTWVLDVEAVRWVGASGRVAWVPPAEHAAAEPDPTPPAAPGAVAHLNADHADSLLAAARAFTGHPDATGAQASRLDRYGIDLVIETPRGPARGRAPFDPPVTEPGGLRAAAVALARAAEARLS